MFVLSNDEKFHAGSIQVLFIHGVVENKVNWVIMHHWLHLVLIKVILLHIHCSLPCLLIMKKKTTVMNQLTPRPVLALHGVRIVQIAIGSGHVLALSGNLFRYYLIRSCILSSRLKILSYSFMHSLFSSYLILSFDR